MTSKDYERAVLESQLTEIEAVVQAAKADAAEGGNIERAHRTTRIVGAMLDLTVAYDQMELDSFADDVERMHDDGEISEAVYAAVCRWLADTV